MKISAISNTAGLCLRSPALTDGRTLHQLAKDAGTLDVNSPYAYLLPALHHADASILAEIDGRPAGFISGYQLPDAHDQKVSLMGNRLFVWQVAVHPDFRGQKLARTMLLSLLARPCNRAVRYIETTVTPSNTASMRVFESVAAALHAQMAALSELESHLFDPAHEAEVLFRIGPFDSTAITRL